MLNNSSSITQADRETALQRAQNHAPFLERLARQFPDAIQAFIMGEGSARLSGLVAARWDGEADIMPYLRRQRSEIALLTALRDLSGEASLTETIQTLSAFADRAIDDAIRAAFAERVPGEEVRGFAVIALGKHGKGLGRLPIGGKQVFRAFLIDLLLRIISVNKDADQQCQQHPRYEQDIFSFLLHMVVSP